MDLNVLDVLPIGDGEIFLTVVFDSVEGVKYGALLDVKSGALLDDIPGTI